VKRVVEQRQGSALVRAVCAFGIACALLALLASSVSWLQGVALVLSVPAVFLGIGALALAWRKNAPLFLPSFTLLLSAAPAVLDNLRDMRTVWVESAEICNPPRVRERSLTSVLLNAATAADYPKVVGSHICKKLGKRFADHQCAGELGRIKCEP